MGIAARFAELGLWERIALISVLATATHLLVITIRRLGERLTGVHTRPSLRKLRSIASLATSAIVFVLYFLAIGFILREFGVSLTAYLASASIIGLAVGFGSQGLVQDVVTGLTLIFTDLFDIGEMVELSGQSGIVRQIGMRFVELENSYGARVFIPNRTITNVINYPRGYVRCIMDITLPRDPEIAEQMQDMITGLVPTVYEQFPGILLTPPSIEGRMSTSAGKQFLRVKFRIWPNRGDPIEKTFKQEVADAAKHLDSAYSDWMIAVSYEVEKKIRKRPN